MAVSSVKIIKGKKVHVTFRNSKIKDYFVKLCDAAPKTVVDWAKFRELDKSGIFSDFTNEQLSMKIRNLRLKAAGLCWYCGTREATTGSGTCDVCWVKVKSANSSYLQSIKEGS